MSSETCDSTAGMVDPRTRQRVWSGPAARHHALIPDDDRDGEPGLVRAAPQRLTAGSTARLDDGPAGGERGERHPDRDAAEAGYVLGAASRPGHRRGRSVL